MKSKDHGTEFESELTPGERQAFDALPRVQIPPADLEDRVVQALHGRGLLRRSARGSGGRGFRGWLAAAAVAGLALFTSGVAVGQWLGGQNTRQAYRDVLGEDPLGRALAIQEAGSEYVRAVARLAELIDEADDSELSPGQEAARASVHAVLLELSRLSPEDETVQLMLGILERGTRDEQEVVTARQTFWF
jgi:hypothetical protein